jgi:hypothetical protein
VETSRTSSRSIPRGRLRYSRLTAQHQVKSGTHTPLESRGHTPDVFTEEVDQEESRWHISTDEDELRGDDNTLNEDSHASGMAMDQDYLTSPDSYFHRNLSPLPPLSPGSYALPVFRHKPTSIVHSTSEGSGSGNSANLAFHSATHQVTHHVGESFAARRGHLSSSLERTHHMHQHLDIHHSRHPFMKKHKRAGSTPPAPLSSGGHINTLRFTENKRHSQSASHTLSNSRSDSRTSFALASSEQVGSMRDVVVNATVTPMVVPGVAAFSDT